jgi:LysR family transcriptional regulator (chromosome initiation inhibitor)
MKRPDYRTLQALDAVIRERGFERAAQKLCITQSAVSQRIKQLENMFGQPLLVRTVPPRPTEQGQNCWPCCVRLNCWKRSGWVMNKPAPRRCCCRWR